MREVDFRAGILTVGLPDDPAKAQVALQHATEQAKAYLAEPRPYATRQVPLRGRPADGHPGMGAPSGA